LKFKPPFGGFLKKASNFPDAPSFNRVLHVAYGQYRRGVGFSFRLLETRERFFGQRRDNWAAGGVSSIIFQL